MTLISYCFGIHKDANGGKNTSFGIVLIRPCCLFLFYLLDEFDFVKRVNKSKMLGCKGKVSMKGQIRS